MKIGDMLRSGRVGVLVDDSVLNSGKPEGLGAKGQYDPYEDRMCFPTDWVSSEEDFALSQKYALQPMKRDPNAPVFRNTAERRATLIHEATHALIDLSGIRVFRLRDEIAARLASTVYLHHSHELKAILRNEYNPERSLWLNADTVARREGLYEKLGVRLFRRDLHPLLEEVRRLYNFPLTARAHADGID